MKIYTLNVGMLETNCYLIENVDSGHALCIDPGGDAETILSFCKKNKLTIEKIILTHGHYDHIGAVNALVDLFNIPVWIHPEDVHMATHSELNLSSFIAAPYVIDSYMNYFEIGVPISFGNQQIDVLHTPGHNPCPRRSAGGCCHVTFREKDSFTGNLINMRSTYMI